MSLEHAAQALDAARRAHTRICEQRAQGQARIRGMGHDDPLVELEHGVCRNGQRIAAALPGHLEQMRSVAQHEGLRQSGWERIDKAERVVPKLPATIECVSRYVAQHVAQLDWTPPVAFARHAQRSPSDDLERVAQTRSVRDGAPLRALAERLRAPWCELGGVLHALSPEAHHQLHDAAQRLATVFQRSRSNVAGRNGDLSLRSPQLRGRDLPRQRACFTAIHNFFLTRPDGTTAAERFFGQKPRSMFAAILESVELAPAPLSPPRTA
jgi:Family of unknown function (DUF6399)